MKRSSCVFLFAIIITSGIVRSDDLHEWKSSAGRTIEAKFLNVNEADRTVTLLVPKRISFDQLDETSLELAQRLANETQDGFQTENASADSFAKLPYDDQVSRLFAMTWDANDVATTTYSGNGGLDRNELKDFAWLNCIRLKTSVFFKDAGLKLKTTQNEALIELPEGSDAFKAAIRILDKYHFALRVDRIWLVFRARDWEDDHYRPFRTDAAR